MRLIDKFEESQVGVKTLLDGGDGGFGFRIYEV